MAKLRILNLTLEKKAFEVMVTGEKTEEFRKYSEWIYSRLYDYKTGQKKEYDLIKFVNGYGKAKPYFICKYEGFLQCKMPKTTLTYSNGLTVSGIGKNDFIIYCGDIIERGNLGCR